MLMGAGFSCVLKGYTRENITNDCQLMHRSCVLQRTAVSKLSIKRLVCRILHTIYSYEVDSPRMFKRYAVYKEGQTNGKISVRREEQKLAVRSKQTTSALTQHVLMTGHKIDFEKTITISTSEHLPRRIIREAKEIEKCRNNLNNRDDAQPLSPAWGTVLKYIPTDRLQKGNTGPAEH
ncbi:hypothetical protein Trydic_g8327 [Trypoxylus dichotomus]